MVLVVALMTLLVVGCGGGAAPSGAGVASLNDATKKLAAAAKAEGALDMVSTLNGGAALGQALIDDFNKRYGLTTQLKYTPSFSFPDEAAKLVAEHKAGQPPHTDMFLGTADFIRQLSAAGAVDTLQLPDPTGVDPKLIAQSNGVAAPFYTILPGIAYNTNLVKGSDVPQNYSDLLNENVPMASTPYAAGFLTLASPAVWGPDKAIAFAQAYSKKLAGLIGCGNENQVASGQFAILAPDCAENFITILKGKGAPIAFVIPKDASMLYWYWGSVLKGAAHPNTAQLFVNYLQTPGAQKIIYKYDFSDCTCLAGSKVEDEVKSYEAKGYKFVNSDFDFLAANNGVAQPAYGRIIGILQASAKK